MIEERGGFHGAVDDHAFDAVDLEPQQRLAARRRRVGEGKVQHARVGAEGRRRGFGGVHEQRHALAGAHLGLAAEAQADGVVGAARQGQRRQAGDLRRQRHRQRVAGAHAGLAWALHLQLDAVDTHRQRGGQARQHEAEAAFDAAVGQRQRVLDAEAVVVQHEHAAAARQVMSLHLHGVARSQRARGFVGAGQQALQGGEGRREPGADGHAFLALQRGIEGPARQHRQRREQRPRALDQHHADLEGRRGPVVRAQGRPQARHLFGAQRLRRDLEQLDLVGEVGCAQRLEDAGQQRAAHRRGLQRGADGLAREHRGLVQHQQRVAQQHLGLQLLHAVGGEQVVQVQRQRRVGGAAAGGVARRQQGVAQCHVGRGLVQEEVQARPRARAVQRDGVGRQGRNGDAGTQRVGDLVLDDAAVEQVAQHGRDAGDGQRVAHRVPPRSGPRWPRR